MAETLHPRRNRSELRPIPADFHKDLRQMQGDIFELTFGHPPREEAQQTTSEIVPFLTESAGGEQQAQQ